MLLMFKIIMANVKQISSGWMKMHTTILVLTREVVLLYLFTRQHYF